MEKLKKFKVFIVIGIILLVLLGVYCTARVITSKSYSSEEYVKEQQVEAEENQSKVSVDNTEDPEATEDKYSTEKNFDLDSEIQGNMTTAKLVYNKEDLNVRQKDFLGSNYDKYKDVLNGVENSYEDIFKELIKRDHIDPEKSIRYSDIVDKPNLDLQELTNYDYASFVDSLTAIGFYGDTCVLCAYNYPNNPSMSLVLIDYSEHDFVISSEQDAFGFGDTVNVSIMPKQGKVQSINGWQVFFIKG